MLIANPIYDVVFKYMMEDAKVAKIFLSAIIGKEVSEIQFLPQELSSSGSDKRMVSSLALSVYRLDFSAKIRHLDGNEEVVIIEVQKAKMYNDIMRFRKYLGKQYLNENYSVEIKNLKGKKEIVGIPIYSIYFLGETLPEFENHPIVQLKMELIDHYDKTKIIDINYFVKSLYHEGTIISIPALKGKRREELELLLSIFDQDNTTDDMHIVNVKEQDFPEQFKPIIRRLQKAVEVREVREVMEIEDDFVKEILAYENRVKMNEEMLAVAQQKQVEAQQKQVEAQQKQAEAQQKQDAAIIMMLQNGLDKNLIANQLQLSEEYIETLLRKL